MLHALLLTTDAMEELTATDSPEEGTLPVVRTNAILLPQLPPALPLSTRVYAMVQRLNTSRVPTAATSGEKTAMNASQRTTPFTSTIYRDFALFALAAVAVGIAASLTLAAAIVLVAPEPAHAAQGPRVHRTQFAQAPGADSANTSIQHPAAS